MKKVNHWIWISEDSIRINRQMQSSALLWIGEERTGVECLFLDRKLKNTFRTQIEANLLWVWNVWNYCFDTTIIYPKKRGQISMLSTRMGGHCQCAPVGHPTEQKWWIICCLREMKLTYPSHPTIVDKTEINASDIVQTHGMYRQALKMRFDVLGEKRGEKVNKMCLSKTTHKYPTQNTKNKHKKHWYPSLKRKKTALDLWLIYWIERRNKKRREESFE